MRKNSRATNGSVLLQPYNLVLVILCISALSLALYASGMIQLAAWGSYISVYDPLAVSITAPKTTVNINERVLLTANVFGQTQMAVNTYSWKASDGQSSTTGSTWSVAFPAIGTYRVDLTVTDVATGGATGSASIIITVATTPITSTGSVSPTSGARPLTVTLKVTGSGGSGLYDWTVTWGDGAIDSKMAAGSITMTHTYSKTGQYELKAVNVESNVNYPVALSTWSAGIGIGDSTGANRTLMTMLLINIAAIVGLVFLKMVAQRKQG